MRIVIDMQGAQAESRQRGIGRYTLALVRAMLKQQKGHEIILALNGLFPESVDMLREEFRNVLPPHQIRVWSVPAPVRKIDSSNQSRWEVAECFYEFFLNSLQPDYLIITSIFEGVGCDAVTSVKAWRQSYPVAVILFDLIPLIHRSPYLDNPAYARWYDEKILHLKRTNRLLAISEATRQEGIKYLDFPSEDIVNISSAIDAVFRPVCVSEKRQQVLSNSYGIPKPFVMYTGGIDHRKNVEGLIRAFAKLPQPLQQSHQLAIVCTVHDSEKERLQALAKRHGLAENTLVLTGYVPEQDLLDLYNLCDVFVFPSWHEGFGLPALEAMSCGAPVIASNTTSLPEVVGWVDALFDPYSEHAIAEKIARVLTDDAFRSKLKQHGLEQAKRFSWDVTASAALNAMVSHVSSAKKSALADIPEKPKLAFVSPLPPERSGISNYSSELLPVLAEYYSIDVIVDQTMVSDHWVKNNCKVRDVQWLRNHADDYDRVLYQFGNSAFHHHMFDLLEEVPGVVVLHDFFLSGIIAHREWFFGLSNSWIEALYHSHGYVAVAERYHQQDAAEVVWRFPCNLEILQKAQGVIVHSPSSRRMARDWYGMSADAGWFTIPHLRQPVNADSQQRNLARQVLNLSAEQLVVCSFGFIGPTKLNHRLLDAWLASSFAHDKNAVLIFVGDKDAGDYSKQLSDRIRDSGLKDRIRITGWTDDDTYHQHLAAADIDVQLRTLSRGETSGAVLHAMNYGLATIVNANGSMADLPEEAVIKLPDEFSDAELVDALENLHANGERRKRLGRTAADSIHRDHSPAYCARLYRDAIEASHQHAQGSVSELVKALRQLSAIDSLSEAERCQLASCIDRNMPEFPRKRQILLDVTPMMKSGSDTQPLAKALLDRWIEAPPHGCRVEPVYVEAEGYYLYARRFTLSQLGCDENLLTEEPVNPRSDDIWLGVELPEHHREQHADEYRYLSALGLQVGLTAPNELPGSVSRQVEILESLLPAPSDEQQPQPEPQLLIDISELVRHDAATGIQRVVRNIIDSWSKEPPAGYHVRLIYAAVHGTGYFYARSFSLAQLGWPVDLFPGSPVQLKPGDLYLGLDLQPTVVINHLDTYRRWREQGVHTAFVVYDLLCVHYPEYFSEGAEQGFSRWLHTVSESHQLICISQAVAHQLQEWMEQQLPGAIESAQLPCISWFHLGAELDNLPSIAQPDQRPLPEERQAVPTLLMVGTLEPRKGHQQALAACEQLWKSGHDVNLVIVGKPGWHTEKLCKALHQHPEKGHRLFWWQACDDATLAALYRTSSALLAASYDEGFGLPLIEAARYGLAIIARDIPVFREVAGQHASYFQAATPESLAHVLATWLTEYIAGQHISAEGLQWQTWQQSAAQLAARLPAARQT